MVAFAAFYAKEAEGFDFIPSVPFISVGRINIEMAVIPANAGIHVIKGQSRIS